MHFIAYVFVGEVDPCFMIALVFDKVQAVSWVIVANLTETIHVFVRDLQELLKPVKTMLGKTVADGSEC